MAVKIDCHSMLLVQGQMTTTTLFMPIRSTRIPEPPLHRWGDLHKLIDDALWIIEDTLT